jgi:DNA-binding GntR family transcriptional regulator
MSDTKAKKPAENGASLTSRVYQELRADILGGRVPPGKKLRINELQNRFDVSLSVVREALSRLCAEDLVRALDQRGFVSAEMSLEDLKDLMRTRRQIEGIAIRQAIELGNHEWEAKVSASYGELALVDHKPAELKIAEDEWVRAHDRFHHNLIQGCDSPWLIRLCAQLSERTQRYRRLSISLAPHRDGASEHKEIFRAVLARDAVRAAEVLDNHFATTEKILVDAWSKNA